MLPLLTATIFLGAALLFLLEPLAGKLYLPLLGGSPAVWNTCLMFFQGVLLLGYLYAHRLARLPMAAQQWVHLAVIAAAAISLPIRATSAEPSTDTPALWLLGQLALTFGPAFFAIAATGTLLQAWFSRTRHERAQDPYFLYAASNAGSAAGLLAYPLLVEPSLTRTQQSWAWTGAFAVFAALTATTTFITRRSAAPPLLHSSTPPLPLPSPSHPLTVSPSQRLRWLLYALIPSSLMMGVTQHITTDIAAVPLLWVLPLTLYLLSYTLAFARSVNFPARFWGNVLVLPAAIVLTLLLSHVQGELLQAPVHLITFFIAATMCHRALAESRPPAQHLTTFYLTIALGGALGGVFNALLAPLIFNAIVEYPLMLGLVCLARPTNFAHQTSPTRKRGSSFPRDLLAASLILAATLIIQRIVSASSIDSKAIKALFTAAIPAGLCLLTLVNGGTLRFGLTALFLLLLAPFTGTTAGAILRHRSFFGVTTVIEWADGKHRTLCHGTTNHGQQVRRVPSDPATDELSRTPTTYYHPDGPLGNVIAMLRDDGRLHRIVGVGLGAGTIAAYADTTTSVHFIEIDPGVVEIASNPTWFTYLSDARERGAQVTTWVGDGRLGVAALTELADLIILDAFSSDAIPVHLMTAEALDIYLRNLSPRGVVMFHVSSRTFRLAPIVAALAHNADAVAYLRNDLETKGEKFASEWVAVARSQGDLLPLTLDPRWTRLTPAAGDPVWTDDYTNLLKAINW
ncbi:MAG TPA: hypothetical protein VD997_15210 [Phycisphaerales bacterium]|nr:hypothetical protein [Phycisphaerales bacterium]